jgi:peptide/nickel transport system substrate-binding protein
VIAACGATPSKAAVPTVSGAKQGGTLVVGQKGEPKGLDPALNTGTLDGDVYTHIYNGLVRMKPDLRIEPDLAESWNISLDQMQITFKLRKNVRFHNGREVTASDWVYSLERVRDPKTGSPGQGQFANVDTITAVDPYTLRMTTKGPLGGLLTSMTFFQYWKVVPREVVEANKDLNKTPVGTGPFKLKNWERGVKIELVKNPDYFEKGLPHLDGITFQFIPDEASAIAALRAGKVDFIRVDDLRNASVLQKDTAMQYYQKEFIGYTMLVMNTRFPPFNNQKVRQAVGYAINREDVIAASLAGVGRLTGPLPMVLKDWAVPLSQFPSYKVDRARAKQLLTEAGYPNGFKTDLMANKGIASHVSDATVIQAQLKEIGIDVSVLVEESGTWVTRLTKNKDVPMTLNTSAGYPHPDMVLYNAYHSKGGWNWSGISDPQLDKLLENAMSAATQEKKADLYKQAQLMLVNDLVPYVWVHSPDSVYATAKYLKDFLPQPDKELRGFRSVWLDK